MKVLIAGASGLIGTALTADLRAAGDEVVALVRRAAHSAHELSWDPARRWLPAGALDGVDAVVNLSGAGVGDRRWTPAYRSVIMSSRVDATATLATAIAATRPLPAFVSSSAIGFYGDTGDAIVDESASPGTGFLTDVVLAWEAATAPAADAGARVVLVRTGLVMAANGGALGRMLPLFRAGLGGRLGTGRQWWSFISLRDEIRALRHCLAAPTAAGPFNLTAPQPARNVEVTHALGRILGRPTLASVPAFALRTALGGFAVEVLGSTRVVPTALLDAGFTFADPTIDAALTSALGHRD